MKAYDMCLLEDGLYSPVEIDASYKPITIPVIFSDELPQSIEMKFANRDEIREIVFDLVNGVYIHNELTLTPVPIEEITEDIVGYVGELDYPRDTKVWGLQRQTAGVLSQYSLRNNYAVILGY